MRFVKEIGLHQRREPRQHGGASDLPWDDVQYFFDLDETGTLPDPEGDHGYPVLGFDVEAERVVLLAERPVS
jgi:hypothetical protein